MKVVALNGSPRLIGNTSAAVSLLLDEMEKQGFETEHIQMYGSIMTPCNDCRSCEIRGDGRCINEDDDMNMYLEKLMDADAVILASPSYFGGIPGQMRILLERITLSMQTCATGNKLSRKVGAAVVIQGRDGGLPAYSEMVNFMLRNKMIVCGSSSPTVLTGTKPSEAMNDKKGVASLKELSEEIAWVLSRITA